MAVLQCFASEYFGIIAKEESLSGSLLKFMDITNASKADLTEAFCRDIESSNEAFQV